MITEVGFGGCWVMPAAPAPSSAAAAFQARRHYIFLRPF